MNRYIYKSTKHHAFYENDGKYYFKKEGKIHGYGMGAYSKYDNIYEISKEEFNKQIIYIDTILKGTIEEDTLYSVIKSLSDRTIPKYQLSDDFMYDITKNGNKIPNRVLLKGNNLSPVYSFGIIYRRSEKDIVYWECIDFKRGYITNYKIFNSFEEAYKEAINFILLEYNTNR